MGMGRIQKYRARLVECRKRASLAGEIFDFVWVRGCWRPVKSYRTIKRGKKKGWIEVVLYYPENRKVKVQAAAMRYKEIDYAFAV